MYGDVIFENYELFLKEHRDDVSTPMGAIEMLSSDGSFRAYIAAITEGLTPTAKSVVSAICEREREMLLEESANIGSSASAIGYAVTYFPILADIYSDPIISEIATVYPVSKSILTIPRIKLNGSVLNSDGTTSKFRIPRSNILERQKTHNINLLPNVSNNLFTLAGGLNSEDTRVNKRYFIVTEVIVKDDDTTPNSHTVSIMVRPDARGQVSKEFTFTDPNNASAIVNGKIVGNIDWDRGIFQFGCTFASTSPAVYSAVSIAANTIFSSITSDVGRVKVKLEIDGWDKYGVPTL